MLDLCCKLKNLFSESATGCVINVHFGGSLHQDRAGAENCSLDHGEGKVTHHSLKIKEGSFLFHCSARDGGLLDALSGGQSVAPNFSVAAVSEDGFIEAIERGSTFAVEWHPESDRTGESIYSLFVERARQRKKR